MTEKFFSAPSTSKHSESEEQDVYDIEKLVEGTLTKSGIKLDSTNNDRFGF